MTAAALLRLLTVWYGLNPLRPGAGFPPDVALQALDRATNTPVFAPDIRVKLYVVNGQQLSSPPLNEAAGGLYLSDEGHPLFAAAGSAVDVDLGVPIDLTQVRAALTYLLLGLYMTFLMCSHYLAVAWGDVAFPAPAASMP